MWSTPNFDRFYTAVKLVNEKSGIKAITAMTFNRFSIIAFFSLYVKRIVLFFISLANLIFL